MALFNTLFRKAPFVTISIGPLPDCDQCQSLYGMNEEELGREIENGMVIEPHIQYDCDSCGSSIQQDITEGHLFEDDGQFTHISLCQDCVQKHS